MSIIDLINLIVFSIGIPVVATVPLIKLELDQPQHSFIWCRAIWLVFIVVVLKFAQTLSK